jgi:hypothetical protein
VCRTPTAPRLGSRLQPAPPRDLVVHRSIRDSAGQAAQTSGFF